MKKAVVVCLLCVGLYLLWQSWATRSETIALDGSGYELTYTVAWGWSMQERVSLAKPGQPSSDSDWIELFEKPYNSGVAVYQTADGRAYYLGLLYHTMRFDPASGVLDVLCRKPEEVAYTAEARFAAKDNRLRADTGAPSLFEYVDGDWLGASTGTPVASKYYADLLYLGRFGVLDGNFRGADIGFQPAAAPESQMALDASCD